MCQIREMYKIDFFLKGGNWVTRLYLLHNYCLPASSFVLVSAYLYRESKDSKCSKTLKTASPQGGGVTLKTVHNLPISSTSTTKKHHKIN